MLNLYTKNYKDFVLLDENHNPVHKFAGAKFVHKALPGDFVEQTETGCTLVKRINHPPIAGLLELNSKTKYGFTAKNHPIYLFIPFNEAYPPFVVGSSEKDTSKNRLALIQFDLWTDTFPRGNLQKLLDSEEEALSWTYTPLACQKYKGPLSSPPIINQSQRPLVKAFHIDPPDCRDVDDVLSITSENNETFITITISDVAAHIPKDHPLDQRAALIAQTFYQDGNKPRHVFPPELSEQALSLLPSTEPKLGLSLKFPLNNPSKVQWFESQVLTTKTYTYESVYNDPSICTTLKQMSQALNEPTDDSHKWIEVAMKFYNTESAKLLQKHQTGLLRSHDKPNEEKLQSLMKINPDLQFLAYSSAQYVKSSEPNPYHFGLQSSAYTHATSPIRRYADLVNQRSIKALLNQQPIPPSPSPYHLNVVAKQAKRHDRDLTFIKALQSSQTNKTVQGQVLQLTAEDQITKLSIYVSDWQLMVKLRYKTGNAPNEVISKDEKNSHTIHEGQLVTLTYHADMTARNWKKRMVIRLL
jgi:hypothetical protein